MRPTLQKIMRIVITGATGFLGSHLVEAALAAKHEVVATGRRVEEGDRDGVTWRQAHLSDAKSLRNAFAGCDALVANAALSPGRKAALDDAFVKANEEGSVAQLEAAAASNVRRVVYISTVAVYRTRLGRALAEDAERIDPDNPAFDWNRFTTDRRYSLSKARAERAVWSTAERLSLDVTALRPGPIYGPRDTKLSAHYGAWLRRSVAAAPTLRLPHVHARDVADAAISAIATPVSIGNAYNLTGESVSVARLLRAWRTQVPHHTRLIPVPVPLMVGFDDQAARRDLDFLPRSIEAGVVDTAAWYEAWAGPR